MFTEKARQVCSVPQTLSQSADGVPENVMSRELETKWMFKGCLAQ